MRSEHEKVEKLDSAFLQFRCPINRTNVPANRPENFNRNKRDDKISVKKGFVSSFNAERGLGGGCDIRPHLLTTRKNGAPRAIRVSSGHGVVMTCMVE